MDTQDLFKLDLNLQQLSTIAIGTRYWQSSVMRKRVMECWNYSWGPNFLPSSNEFNFDKDFFDLPQIIKHQLRNVHLPEKILAEIHDTIDFLGRQIYSWMLHVVKDLWLDVKYADQIYWTCYGVIDEEKIFQLYWEKDLSLYDMKDCTESSIYSLACIFGQEKFIDKNLSKMCSIVKGFCAGSLNLPRIIKKQLLLKVWICYYIGGSMEKGKKLYENLKNPGSQLLIMCARAGYFHVFKHFADTSAKGQDIYFMRIAEETLDALGYLKKHTDDEYKNYKEKLFAKILFFLINRMLNEQQISFLVNNFTNFVMNLIDIRPYKRLLLPLYQYVIRWANSEIQEQFLAKIVFTMENHVFQNLDDTKIVKQILENLLERSSKDVKEKIFNEYSFRRFLEDANFPILDVILDDADFKVWKTKLLDIGQRELILQNFIRKGDLSSWDHILVLAFSVAEERKDFIVKLNILEELVAEGNFQIADGILDWLADSDKEKMIQFKRQINSAGICLSDYEKYEYFNFYKAEELLNWQYDGDEEQIKLVKNVLALEDLVRNEVFSSWTYYSIASVELAERKCLEVLGWFLEPEEVDYFRKEKLIIDESFVKVFRKHLRCPKDFKTIDALFEFCELPAEKIKKIKQYIVNNDVKYSPY